MKFKEMNFYVKKIIFLIIISFWITESCSSDTHVTNVAYNKSPLNGYPVAGKFTYLALGDSYTIGESVDPMDRWPVLLVNKLNDYGMNVKGPEIIAKTGWTTNELEAEIENSALLPKYNLVSLLIGVNNQYRGRDTSEYRKQFAGLLAKAISFAGGYTKNVIVVSIPDYGVTPFGLLRNPQKIAIEIDAFNAINKEEAFKVGCEYVDITGISRKAASQPSLTAVDGLHPSGEMYKQWVDLIFPVAKKILSLQ